MNVCVVGIGYVGLVTASCLAEAGSKVICVDSNKEKIDMLKNGQIPIYEPGLAELVQHNQKAGRLHFTNNLKEGIDNCLFIFIAVGTPSLPDGSADLSAVLSVASQIAEYMTEYRIIATKSTVPVGTYKTVTDLIKSKTAVPFDYVSNPEFLKEGAAIEDCMRPDRIIIGTENPAARELMNQLYNPFMRKGNRIVFMDNVSAELTKYAANTMLAARISFMNELSQLCEMVGADIEMVRQGIGSDSRIGRSFLFAGIGFGGSCFPKDIRALIDTGRKTGLDMAIPQAVQNINIAQQQRFAEKVKNYFSGHQTQTTLAVWGLAFKARTDDIRESPAIYCIEKFIEWGFKINAYDPEANAAASAALGERIEICHNSYEALAKADALVILTDWQEFRNPDFALIKKQLKKPVIFDGRNLYDTAVISKAGFEYYSIGRPPVIPKA
ncbi:MAG: UDP-glucose/GDP-mannose dehydrogenase family protein [Phycisphaerae bacterium]